MSAQIIFLSLFLGVVGGSQPVALQVSGPIKTVRVVLGDREVAVLTQAPWRATIDMGHELTPRELTAIGFDAEGKEIARTRQILNLPRPIAEFDIAMEYDGGGRIPTGFSLPWRHLKGIKPDDVKATFDGQPLPLDRKPHAQLPKMDLEMPHVISAEIRFNDGFIARRETVIESVRSDSGGTQLTPIAVRETSAQHPASWDGCLVEPGGRAVRTSAVESPRAVVIVVRDPDDDDAFGFAQRERNLALAAGTVLQMIWPVGQHFDNGDAGAFLFTISADVPAERLPFPRFLSLRGPVTTSNESRYFADAVSVAGIRATTGGQRRAVILILGDKNDTSTHAPAAVRRYLASIGVPLFVWSPAEIAPRSAKEWGEYDDVSSVAKLAEALQRVRRTLDEQRIAWVNVDPLSALQLQAKESCGIETSAKPSAPRASAP